MHARGRMAWHGALAACAAIALVLLCAPDSAASAADPASTRITAASAVPKAPTHAGARLRPVLVPSGLLRTAPSMLRLKGGGGEVIHEHSFEIRSGAKFSSKVTREDGGVRCHMEADGNLKDLTLHWGVALNDPGEWLAPQKTGLQSIVPQDSVYYKERAVRTKFVRDGDKLKLDLFVSDDTKPKIPLGVRFVLFEPSSDSWYPGGAGGNFYVPVAKEEQGKHRPPALQRSPSFTGAVDYEKMNEKSRPVKHDTQRSTSQVQLTDNLSHLMWNGAQRQKAWVDGKKESHGMRIQRSISFDSAVKVMATIQEEEAKAKKEAEDFWKNEKGRLYTMPLNYNGPSGRRKGQVKVAVSKEKKVKITVKPEAGDEGPGELLVHWGIGWKDVFGWEAPSDDMVKSIPNTSREGSAAQSKMVKSGSEQTLEFEFPTSPQGITFVLKDTKSNSWYKNGDNNFHIGVSEEGRDKMTKSGGGGGGSSGGGQGGIVRTLSGTDIHPPQGAGLAQEIFDAESKGSVTLMHRYNHAASLIDRTPPGPAGKDAIMMIFVWLRFSQIRQLSWQRNYNTKPRELSGASDNLNKMIAWRWKNSAVAEKEIFRLMLGCIGRGGSGGDGQAIRDEILHIMHRHHLPESKGNWVEEWHQKLHNNSTPDDIIICQAYLAFLASGGNMGEYLRVLQENGLSPEALTKYERPIVTQPVFYGDKKDGLINDFNNYLRILKNVHAGADLEKCVEVCQGFLDGHINVLLEAILRERGASDNRVLAVIDSITEVRQLIGSKLGSENDVNKVRDMLYLDIGLEAQMRLMAERAISSVDGLGVADRARSLALWAAFAAENLIYSSCPGVGQIVDMTDPSASANEMKACVRDWADLVEEAHKGLPSGWAPKAMPVVERMRRALGEIVEHITGSMQNKAEYLGYGLCQKTPEKIPEKWSITLFSEELIRGGGCSFVLSSLLRKLDKTLRDLGGGAKWQIISHGMPGAEGELVEVDDLLSIQSHVYDKPTILLANSISGEEEVPAGVKGVITKDAPDVLAHISVRARNLKVLFATCFDEEEFEGLGKYLGKYVRCMPAKEALEITEMDAGGAEEGKKGFMESLASSLGGMKLDLPPPAKFSSYCLPESKIDPDLKPRIHGAKTTNIVKVRRTLPDWIQTPRSAVVPFGVFEKVLSDGVNKDVAKEYNDVVNKELPNSKDPEAVLHKLKALIHQLKASDDLKKNVKSALVASEIIKEGELEGAQWEEAYTALKSVWASKWNDRAYYSCKKAGIGQQHVQMAVLVQRLVEAEYAFVVHTVNPSSEDPSEMYAEVVVGLGEVLVGNFPGRALGFSMKKDMSSPGVISSLPSKSVGLFGGGLIFRSDSNGEDLPGFAGAGLYDSVPMVKNIKKTIMYHKEPLLTDKGLQEKIMKGICQLAVDVEKSMGGEPQDIEGCYKDGKFYVVQTRPQV